MTFFVRITQLRHEPRDYQKNFENEPEILSSDSQGYTAKKGFLPRKFRKITVSLPRQEEDEHYLFQPYDSNKIHFHEDCKYINIFR